MLRLNKRLLLVGSLLLVGGAVAGIAYAVIPSNNTITGCYTKSGGSLRVIDATVTNCKSSETKLEWNQQGPKGDPGTNGTNGANGTNGTNGVDGTNGVSGYERIPAEKTYNAPFSDNPADLQAQADCPTGKVATGGGGFVQYYNAAGYLRLGSIAFMRATYLNVDTSYSAGADVPPAGVTQIVVHAEAFCITAG